MVMAATEVRATLNVFGVPFRIVVVSEVGTGDFSKNRKRPVLGQKCQS